MTAVYAPEERVASNANPPKLLDRLRHVLRAKHYAYRTEQAYVGWVKRFILFHHKRHPQEMRGAEVERVAQVACNLRLQEAVLRG
ncbi:MAG: phage integrase N-terminal SAM-like domain-containing protein [Pirellulales bacterium]|nr:phage integrase N-terminal SAM-like domain-containing protein [Pirellulales bacterium]